MNKLSTLALAGLLAVSVSAVASDSRMAGFGASSAFIADVQDIWTLPAVVASNKDAAYYEMGDYTQFGVWPTFCCPEITNDPNENTAFTGQAWGGVHAQVGPGVLGIWVGRPTSLEVTALLPGFIQSFSMNGGLNRDAANGNVDLLYGFGLGEKVDMGVSISRANSNEKVVSNYVGGNYTATWDANSLGFGIGADIKEVAIFKLLQVGLVIENAGQEWAEKDSDGSWDKKQTQGVTVFGLRAGADVAGDEGKFGRLELGYKMGSGKATQASAQDTQAVGFKERLNNGTIWNLGYALGKSSDKGMGLAGLMLEGISNSSENDSANSKSSNGLLTLALSTAGEAKVKEWLTARAGLSANLFQSVSSESFNNPVLGTTTTTNHSNSSATPLGTAVTTISTGLSMNFGDLTIDGVLNQDVLFTGTYLISGLQETLFSKVSATWGW